MSRIVVMAGLAMALGTAAPLPAAYRNELIPQPVARVHGLERAWFAQVDLDRARGRVTDVVLHNDMLYVQTDRAMIHAFDAETGATVWARMIGQPGHPSLAPGLNQDFLGVVNGSHLYVVNRYTGEAMWDRRLENAPGAGPALSNTRAYVPLTNGQIYTYRILPETGALADLGKVPAGQGESSPSPSDATAEELRSREQTRREGLRISQTYAPYLVIQGTGRPMVQPIVTRQDATEEMIAWPTNRNFVFFGHINIQAEDKFRPRYRLETSGEVIAQLSFLPADKNLIPDSGIILAGTMEGYVYGFLEKNGSTLWRFSTGEAIVQPCAAVGNRVFAATQLGGMFCLDAVTGAERWFSPAVARFIAASPSRVYAADRLGRIRVLDVNTGALLDTIDASASPLQVLNEQNDRLYLVTTTGLVQCLREIELVKPVVHRVPAAAAPKAEKPKPKPAAAKPAAEGEANPFGDDEPAGDFPGAEEPAAEEPPAGEPAEDEPADDDNPFGGDAGGGDAMGGDDAAAAGDADAAAGADDNPFGGDDAGAAPAADDGAAGDDDNPFGGEMGGGEADGGAAADAPPAGEMGGGAAADDAADDDADPFQ